MGVRRQAGSRGTQPATPSQPPPYKKVHWLDEKFKADKARYLLQCLLATGAVMGVLLLLDTLQATAIIASLGATSFIAFTMPHTESSRPRYLLGGYAVGITIGSLFKLIWMSPLFSGNAFLTERGDVVFGALAIGCTILLMVLLNFEHPPACGMALGVVLNEFNLRVLLIVIVGVAALTALKTWMKPILRNLL